MGEYQRLDLTPLCMIVRFKNVEYKIWALTEETLLEEKNKLIKKLEEEFVFVEYIKIDAAREFAIKEGIHKSDIFDPQFIYVGVV